MPGTATTDLDGGSQLSFPGLGLSRSRGNAQSISRPGCCRLVAHRISEHRRTRGATRTIAPVSDTPASVPFSTLPVHTAEAMERHAAVAMGLAAAGLETNRRKLYAQALGEVAGTIDVLFTESNNLRNIMAVRSKDAKAAMRFVVVPFVSADNLTLLCKVERDDWPGWKGAGRPKRELMYVREHLSVDSFPWIGEDRDPTTDELTAARAMLVTARATERMQTLSRSQVSGTQEGLVRTAAHSAGFVPAGVYTISSLSQLPPGTCTTGEAMTGPVGGAHKADHVLRTATKLICVEAKSSGSITNSFKRIVTECENKTRVWSDHFMDDAVVVAVIGGAVSASQALRVQATGAFVVWDHDLDPYEDWLRQVRSR